MYFVFSRAHYLKKMECWTSHDTLQGFRSARMKLSMLIHWRPHCLFEIAQLSQVTESMWSENHHAIFRRIKKAIVYAIDNPVRLRILILDFDLRRFRIRALQVTLTCLINLDVSNASKPITFKSYNCRRIPRSATPCEVNAFAEMFDEAIALSLDMKGIIGRPATPYRQQKLVWYHFEGFAHIGEAKNGGNTCSSSRILQWRHLWHWIRPQ